MGLDMFLLKASESTLDADKVYTPEMMRTLNITCFPADENGAIPEDMDDLKPFLQKIKMKVKCYDFEKIRREFNLTDTPVVTFMSSEEVGFWCGKDNQSVTIKGKDIEKFVKYEVRPYYAVKLAEIGYWRKEYDLEDQVYAALKKSRNIDVQNCGYYRMTAAMMKMVNRYNAKRDFDPIEYAPDDSGSIFYHEWY